MPDVVPGVGVNESQPHVSHKHSFFPIEFDSLDTALFGYVKPHLAVLGVPSDSLRYRPEIHSRSYTLKAPLMQDVFRRLSYVKVNLDAIIPFNAEKVYTNPVKGDDVLSDVNTCVSDGLTKIKNAVSSVLIYGISKYNTDLDSASLAVMLKSLVFAELFYSRGSLLSSLGCHLFSQLTITDGTDSYDFDDYFDVVISDIIAYITGSVDSVQVLIDGTTYTICFSEYAFKTYNNPISFREFLCRIRETSDWSFIDPISSLSAISVPTFVWKVPAGVPFNFMRCAAYQLAVAEFMTNDHIDYIYSAELYRQNIGDHLRSFFNHIGGSWWPLNFTYNGVEYQYDYLSGHYLDYILTDLSTSPSNFFQSGSWPLHVYQYFLDIFGLKRSLRFKDYFVGARSYPLAVGDVNVNVNANLVNVVDISRKIQLQRFLNVVNHTGRRISNYVKTLFGVDLSADRHVPQFLAELSEKVYTAEVENTGAAQLTSPQTITAVFTSNSSNKEISFGIDLPCVIIGLTSYDIARAYCQSIDRDFFIKDRYDMFLPELQFVGDQPVYVHELDSSNLSGFGVPFAYQYRDMQWKQIFSRASGGFISKLPGFAFLYRSIGITNPVISPDFIRSLPSELDEFYVSLTGFSLGNYFHFIEITKNHLGANRPMIANPTILE